MTPGERESSGSGLHPFTHRGKLHYTIDGYLIEASVFQSMRKRGLNDKEIAKQWGKSMDKMGEEILEAERVRWPKITSMRELAEFILRSDLLTEKDKTAVRDKEKGCKTVGEYFALFPECYRPLLRMRHLYDKRKAEHAAKEIESLEHTIAREYNANEFIGETQ